MKIIQHLTELANPDQDLSLGKLLPFLDIIRKRTTFHIINDRKNLRTNLDKIIYLRQILMMQLLQQIRLSPDIDPSHKIILYLFQNYLLLQSAVPGQVHLSGSPFTNFLTDLIVLIQYTAH